MNLSTVQGPEKLKQVKELLSSLEEDLKSKSLTTAQRVQTLLQLRQHGTVPTNADPIYSEHGIDILSKYGVEGETVDVRRAALRCVANALLLVPQTRGYLMATRRGGRLAEMLKCDSSDDEMVISRILFLLTYGTNQSEYEHILNQHGLGDSVYYQIVRHSKQFPKSGKPALSQMDELALIDTLKLIFNTCKISDFKNGETVTGFEKAFSASIPYIFKMISRMEIPEQPLDGLLSYLINCLTVLDLKNESGHSFDSSPLFPPFDPNCNVDRLVLILDRATATYKAEDLETKAAPLLHALIMMAEMAPEGPRKQMQALLLPEGNDRSEPIGQSDTLPSRLLKLSTSPNKNLKITISELLLLLSDNNAETLTQNIGYGYAAGLLASRGMEIPQTAGEAFATNGPAVNPVTGQRWDAEPQDTGPPMTQEEKEREAERLFVLFERARANGLLNVENPVRVAAQEGRLEELPDSDSD
ncbi:hypothetical protein P168DRAFT_303631 [Aspergillus campestris IBT 28561]|uniref:Guanine nucleotide exchange factor n=1 Tax=Aspergillus campestris (strain IBT 28561) TaxID=1392248 RepID=A0A2I1D7U2_ASPC2|nr:uncharacterized protein P168DRAFT_303631 [Aspergillus campestris IBT 28561]PKY05936.1 hypothetical protein P168DRAFT_303631 [Aspergillus campestris IBT 28561]